MSFWSFIAGAAAGAAVTYVLVPKSQVRIASGRLREAELPPAPTDPFEQDRAVGSAGWYVLLYELNHSSKGPVLKEYNGPFLHKTTAQAAAKAEREQGWNKQGGGKAAVKHLKDRPF